VTLAALESPHIMVIIFAGIGGLIAIVAIMFGTLKSVVDARTRERTRSEIAAYVAEGSMTADEGERILRAGGTADPGERNAKC